MNIHRHGEVVLKPSTLPTKAKLVEFGKSVVVGHSESGHHHTLTVPKTQIKIFEFEGKTYLDIPLEAKLEHQKTVEKHETQIIEPGVYERIIKRSYSYSEKVMRRVQD
jgi:hypothetical protein